MELLRRVEERGALAAPAPPVPAGTVVAGELP
jgi:hypothetical protein